MTVLRWIGKPVREGGVIAYIGFSMGTRFRLPYVAAAGSRLR